jgi:hypothetical protein
MTRRINTDQWRDKTQEPAIVCVYDGVWELLPVAVDDSHEADLYQEYASAFYAARAYMTFDEVCEEYADDYTPEQIEDMYDAGDGSADRAGLPASWYVEGTEDGDQIIYVDPETFANSHRATFDEELQYLDPEDVADIYRAILAER